MSRLKRAYQPAAPTDGYRVLIDRLWPRGVSRPDAKLDGWEKELSPSAPLRQWFGHQPRRFQEFRRRYIKELRSQRPRLAALRRRAREGTLTLVYSAQDAEHNDALSWRRFCGAACREVKARRAIVVGRSGARSVFGPIGARAARAHDVVTQLSGRGWPIPARRER